MMDVAEISTKSSRIKGGFSSSRKSEKHRDKKGKKIHKIRMILPFLSFF